MADRVEQAFVNAARANFMPEFVRGEAHLDVPLPIGYGQTISQPTTVKMMLEWLEPQPGDRVLDVGSGSGWTSALLSHVVGPEGKVYAVEIVPELLRFGRENCARAGVSNVEFHKAREDAYGLPEFGPFDRILVSASARELPAELLEQLAVEGKLVIPVGRDILEITRASETAYETQDHPGFLFVPLV